MIKNLCSRFESRLEYAKRFSFSIKKGMFLKPEYEPLLFDAVNIDINNSCNQRCRFCFNTFEKKHEYMTEETFEKVLEVLPLTKNYGGGGQV